MASSAQSGWFREFVRTWGPALFAVLFIRTFIFEPFRIPSGSMVPTLLIGDHVLVTKFSYGIYVPATVVEVPFMETWWVYPRFGLINYAQPERGDIVVFRYPQNESQNYIKRVVGTGGDRVQVKRGKLYVNGELQERKFIGQYSFTDQNCRQYRTRQYVENLDGLNHDTLTALGGDGTSGAMRNTKEFIVPDKHVFVMGDNRDNSLDSRAWGFVRADQVKGKAHFVWLSWDSCEGRMRAERVFRGLYAEPEAATP